MKRNLFYLTILAFIFLLFKNYSLVLSSSIEAVNIWLYKVFPYLFIMIILNDILINLDFAHLFKNNCLYIFIMSLLSGTPTSAYIITNLYNSHKMKKDNANYALSFTYFCNPLFLYAILNSIFNNTSITFKLMFIHYLSNIIIYLIYRKKITKENHENTNASLNIANSIKKSVSTVTMVLGTITLYMVVSKIITTTFAFSTIPAIIFKGFLEVTQGLNALIELNLSLKLKELLAMLFISFGGLSIHTQIKCVIEETDLEYKYFLKGRVLGTIIALLFTFFS